eukprot:INCI765.1.p1 GENE.INCI765.1~~INCI765.1.p1  ORF type:complete len:532 (+),score=92.99 INCI765.1:205-1800(+)
MQAAQPQRPQPDLEQEGEQKRQRQEAEKETAIQKIDIEAIPVKQLQLLLKSQGMDTRACLSRAELLEHAKQLSPRALEHFSQQTKLRAGAAGAAAGSGCPFSSEARAALKALQRPVDAESAVSQLVSSAGAKGLKALLQAQGVDTRSLCDKDEFIARAKQVLQTAQQTSPQPQTDASARLNLARVRYDLAAAMRDCPPFYDDGSYVPLMIRYAWHCCGTYDAESGTGGSNGGTMRFPAEQADPENAGLAKAREIVEKIHAKHSWLSVADISVLAGYVAIEEAGGPPIPFSYGRRDFSKEEASSVYGPGLCPFARKDGVHNPHKSRLPAADLGPDPDLAKAEREGKSVDPAEREAATIAAMRGTFQRMGFDDRETVCLILLGHQFGRCHEEHSGFKGSWYGFDPAHWNIYGPGGLGYLSVYDGIQQGRYTEVVDPSTGKRQYNGSYGSTDPKNPSFMMLIVDMALYWDKDYRKHVEYYQRHRLEFRRDAAHAWKKLTELGCPAGLLTLERNAVPMCSCAGRTPCLKCRPSVR